MAQHQLPGKRPNEAPVSDSEYQGSRKSKARYAYSDKSRSGFIELHPEHVILPAHFKEWLMKVQGVHDVILHPRGSKMAQGNMGNHYQEHNFHVYSKLWPAQPMEFELTRNLHSNGPKLPYTISAMFKEQNDDVYVEAWRVLAAACKGKELMPKLVAETLRRVGSGSLGDPCVDTARGAVSSDQLASGSEHVDNKLAASSDQLSPGSASVSLPKERADNKDDTCDDSAISLRPALHLSRMRQLRQPISLHQLLPA
jgi:hypothetical protein